MLKQKFILHFASGIGTRAITALTGIVVARLAGPEVVGTVAFGVAFVSMYSFSLGLFGSSHMKLISEGKDLGDCIKTYIVIQSTNILLFAIIFTVGFFVQIYYLKYTLSYEQFIVIIIFFIYFLLSQIYSIFQITFTSNIEIAKATLPHILQLVSSNIARIFVVVVGLGAAALTATNFVGLFVSLPLAYYYFKKYPIGKYNRKIAMLYLKISIPFLIIGVCGTLITNFGGILLEHFNNVTEIGYYTAGSSIAGILLLIASTSGTIFFPLFSKLASEKKFDEINEQIYNFELFSLQFILPLVTIISVFSNEIIVTLLGAKYLPSGIVLKLLIISSFFQIISMPHGNLLAGLGLFKLISILNITQVIVFLLSIFVLLSPNIFGLGAAGLSVGTLLLNLFMMVTYIYYAKVITKVFILKNFIIKIIIGISLWVAAELLKSHIDFSDYTVIKLVMATLVYLLVFYSAFFVLKQIEINDFRKMIDLLNIKTVYNYIKGEIKK